MMKSVAILLLFLSSSFAETLTAVGIRTGSQGFYGTENWVTLTLCQVNHEKCCSMDLDDLTVDTTNRYSSKAELGSCYGAELNGEIEATVSIDGNNMFGFNDGWYVEWVNLYRKNNGRWSRGDCFFKTWIDGDHSTET